MALEIERKFLVDLDRLRPLLISGESIKQGYIVTSERAVVRVRIKGEQAFLTLKGKNSGAVRLEFEYPIPLAEAEEIFTQLCSGGTVIKRRYEINHQAHLWEVDLFEGDNQGLVVAEVELQDEHEHVELPEWVGAEVTGDSRYYNVNLLGQPFNKWPSIN
jgi:adenylate cyclase